MDSRAELSPSSQLLLDEIRKLFAEFRLRPDAPSAAASGAPAPAASTTASTEPAPVSSVCTTPAPATSTDASTSTAPVPSTLAVVATTAPAAVPSASTPEATAQAPATYTSVAPALSATPTSTTTASPASASAASIATFTSIDPVARGAKEAVDINSHLRCSTDPGSKAVGELLPVERFTEGVDFHEFIDDDLAASRPHRAPPRPPRPRRPRRAPPRVPHPRRPRRPSVRVHRLRRPWRAPPRPPRLRRPRRTPPRPPRPRCPGVPRLRRLWQAPPCPPRPQRPRRAPLRPPWLCRPRRAHLRLLRLRRPRRAPPRSIRPPRPPWLDRPRRATRCSTTSLAAIGAEGWGDLRAIVLVCVISTTTSTPTRRSTKCLSCIVDGLESEDTGFWTAPTTLLLVTPGIPLGFTNNSSLKHLQRRYIFTIGSSLLSVAAMSDGHGYQKVFQSMTSQCLVMPRLLAATAVDIGPWTHPLQNKNILLNATIKLNISLGLTFSFGQEVVKPWPPPILFELTDGFQFRPTFWPPPSQWKMQSADIQLRPTPWPSFDFHIVVQSEDLMLLKFRCSESMGWRHLFNWDLSWLMMLSYSVGMVPSYHAAIWLESEASKFICQWFNCSPHCRVADVIFPVHLIPPTRAGLPIFVTGLWQRKKFQWFLSQWITNSQAVSALDYLHGYFLYAGYAQLTIQGYSSGVQIKLLPDVEATITITLCLLSLLTWLPPAHEQFVQRKASFVFSFDASIICHHATKWQFFDQVLFRRVWICKSLTEAEFSVILWFPVWALVQSKFSVSLLFLSDNDLVGVLVPFSILEVMMSWIKCLQQWLEFYVAILPVVGFISEEAIAWVQLICDGSFSIYEACKWSCASCQFHTDSDFVHWILWKIPWLFSALLSSSRMEWVLQWSVLLPGQLRAVPWPSLCECAVEMHIVNQLPMFNIWDPGGDLELPDYCDYKAFLWKYWVGEHCLNLLPMVDGGFAEVQEQHQQQFSGSCSLDDSNHLGMGFTINVWRSSPFLRQFYHQVVDDP